MSEPRVEVGSFLLTAPASSGRVHLALGQGPWGFGWPHWAGSFGVSQARVRAPGEMGTQPLVSE